MSPAPLLNENRNNGCLVVIDKRGGKRRRTVQTGARAPRPARD
jgi:hypothetical protein